MLQELLKLAEGLLPKCPTGTADELQELIDNLRKKLDELKPSEVSPIGGRLPINNKYAGKKYPVDRLPRRLRKKYPDSVDFTPAGFPDFSPYAKAKVRLKGLTGDYRQDELRALEALNWQETPAGYVWHHVEDCETLLLVPQDLHKAVRHTGGAAIIRHRNPQ